MHVQLKCYDSHNRLWISKPTTARKAIQMLLALDIAVGVNKAYIKQGRTSTPLHLPKKGTTTVQVTYKGSDGRIYLTYPIRPELQPVTRIEIKL